MWVHINTSIEYISLGSRLFSMLEICSLTLKQRIIIIKKNPNILLSFSIPSLLPPPFLSHPEAQGIDELAASHEAEPT